MKKVTSLFELADKAATDPKYLKLALIASSNLGGPKDTLQSALRWLHINASETDEEGVVDEINFCRDLI